MAISNLVTTGGITTSDLITQPQWTLLASETTSQGYNSLTFSSISQAYRKLKVLVPYASVNSVSGYLGIRFNSNSNNVYTQFGYAEASNTLGITRENANALYASRYITASQYSFEFTIENYSLSTENKFVYTNCVNSGNTQYHEETTTMFASTAAITSITFLPISAATSFNPNPNSMSGGGVFIYGAK